MMTMKITLYAILSVLITTGWGQKDGFLKDCLDAHNKYRTEHGVPPLIWNETLANDAQVWANKLAQEDKFEHDMIGIQKENEGEDLAYFKPASPKCMGEKTDGCVQCREIVKDWYDEVDDYNFATSKAKKPGGVVLHFTQVVWKSTNQFGMATAVGDKYGFTSVARYYPRGNMGGPEEFKKNVLPKGSDSQKQISKSPTEVPPTQAPKTPIRVPKATIPAVGKSDARPPKCSRIVKKIKQKFQTITIITQECETPEKVVPPAPAPPRPAPPKPAPPRPAPPKPPPPRPAPPRPAPPKPTPPKPTPPKPTPPTPAPPTPAPPTPASPTPAPPTPPTTIAPTTNKASGTTTPKTIRPLIPGSTTGNPSIAPTTPPPASTVGATSLKPTPPKSTPTLFTTPVPITGGKTTAAPKGTVAGSPTAVKPFEETTPEQFRKASLLAHNTYRALYQAPPLKWNDQMAQEAQAWAEKIAKLGTLKHTTSKERNGTGENLAMLWGKYDKAGRVSTQMWYDEVKDYSYNNPISGKTGHFTQVVWKDSTELGMGRAKGTGDKSDYTFVVARYKPAGNMIGSFPANVLPKKVKDLISRKRTLKAKKYHRKAGFRRHH